MTTVRRYIVALVAVCVAFAAGIALGNGPLQGDGSPHDTAAVRTAIARLLDDHQLRARMGAAARIRATEEFAYDLLAARLEAVARGDLSAIGPLGR